MGCLPIMTEGVRCSACSRVNAAFLPGRPGRFGGTGYRSVPPREVFSLLGTAIHVRPVGRDVADWFGVDSGFLTM